jgi:putative phosphoribosyl transferase
MLFTDRADSGRQLAARLRDRAGQDVVVVGLPNGGVPVAYEVAAALHAPLEVIVVRKLAVPFQPELGLGAIGEGGIRVINETVLRLAGIGPRVLEEIEQREQSELRRRVRRLRGDRPAIRLVGRVVIVVDDGIATGSTARAACRSARAQGARRIVLAVPVGPPGVRDRFAADADEVCCLRTPLDFGAVGQAYADFTQVSDQQVVELLESAGQPATSQPALATRSTPQPHDGPAQREEDVTIQVGSARLEGHLAVAEHASGLVVFVHGSGSSRHSRRNRYVAAALNRRGLATLLFDLLTIEEESDRGNVFDIDLLAGRLLSVTAWLRAQADLAQLRIGYFGASTGAAAALWAAADPVADVAAVVSRGGRPDLAGSRLGLVRAPTLLIVGGRDEVVIELNRAAQAQLRCQHRLVIVPGATHLFEEPGALESVARLAGDWFVERLARVTSSA